MPHASAAPTNQDSPEGRSPRAFAIGTGFVFQSVGVVLLLGSCCFWSFSGHLVEPASQPTQQWTDHFHGDNLPIALLTVAVVTTVVFGAGLIGVGIGLQGERAGSGTAAVLLTATIAVIYWACFGSLMFLVGAIRSGILSGVFAVVASVFLFLSLVSRSVLRRFPPLPDQNVVTEEMLQGMTRHRPP
jgi:hypothetical protein